MLTALSNGISKLFVNDVEQSQFDHNSKYKISLDTDVLKGNIERAERTLRNAEEKYGKFSGKQRLKRDTVTSASDVIEGRVNQTYSNIVEALANNTSNQTLSSLNVEGLTEEELKNNEYTLKLFKLSFKEKNVDAVRLLIAKGANVNIEDKLGYTPLLYATKSSKDIIKVLIEADANVNIMSDDGKLLLVELITQGNAENVELLLAKGARLNTRCGNLNPMSIAVFGTNNTKIVKSLIRYGANVDEYYLNHAIFKNNKELIDLLLDFDISFRAYYVGSLRSAIQKNDLSLVESLLKKGANPNGKNCSIEDIFNGRDSQECCSATHHAVILGNLDIVKLVVEAGAYINSVCFPNEKGLAAYYTPLRLAVKYGYEEIVKFLLDKGADANVVNMRIPLISISVGGNKVLALDEAIYDHKKGKDRERIIKLLIKAGAKSITQPQKRVLCDDGSYCWVDYLPDFLIRTDEPGVFKLAENATDYNNTISSNMTDVGVSNLSSTMISK